MDDIKKEMQELVNNCKKDLLEKLIEVSNEAGMTLELLRQYMHVLNDEL